MRDYPNIELSEVTLQLFFELGEPYAVFGGVDHIDENTRQIVAVDKPLGTDEPSLNRSGRRIS